MLKLSKIVKLPKIVFLKSFFGPLQKVKWILGNILNLHGLSFLTMVLNVAIAVEMMEKFGVKICDGGAAAAVGVQAPPPPPHEIWQDWEWMPGHTEGDAGDCGSYRQPCLLLLEARTHDVDSDHLFTTCFSERLFLAVSTWPQVQYVAMGNSAAIPFGLVSGQVWGSWWLLLMGLLFSAVTAW